MVSDRVSTWWVCLVTDGTVIEYPPELYASRTLAHMEARRWAWNLSSDGQFPVRERDAGGWQAGFRDIRLVEVDAQPRLTAVPWIGTHWTDNGYPEPEAVVFEDEREAKAWATEPLRGIAATSIDESEWHVAATYEIRDGEAYSVAHRAKVIVEGVS